MDEVFDLLATKRVPSELLSRMMATDNGEFLAVDIPPAAGEIQKIEAAVGVLPADYREWIARFGAAATPNETS
jgi:hypothetical protein